MICVHNTIYHYKDSSKQHTWKLLLQNMKIIILKYSVLSVSILYVLHFSSTMVTVFLVVGCGTGRYSYVRGTLHVRIQRGIQWSTWQKIHTIRWTRKHIRWWRCLLFRHSVKFKDTYIIFIYVLAHRAYIYHIKMSHECDYPRWMSAIPNFREKKIGLYRNGALWIRSFRRWFSYIEKYWRPAHTHVLSIGTVKIDFGGSSSLCILVVEETVKINVI